MIERITRFGRLAFDRDAIVRAALRVYVETLLAWADPLGRLAPSIASAVEWVGDLQCGALYHDNGCGDYDVVAWNDSGVVGLACELGFGPIEQLGLLPNAVTGGPDDVRGAVPGLPTALESAFVMAVGLLATGAGHQVGDTYIVYGEKLAGVGFWLHADHVAGTLFDDPLACGANRLAAWALLRDGRLPLACNDRVVAIEPDRPKAISIHAIVDAVTERRLVGPTELTTDEIATLIPIPPDAERLRTAQRMLQKAGITWPGLPKLAN